MELLPEEELYPEERSCGATRGSGTVTDDPETVS